MTRAALGQRAPAIRAALSNPGVVGFSIRVPWSLLEPTKGHYDFRVLTRARRLAAPKQLSVRFIAGVYTPAFWMGHSMIYDGSVTGGVGAGRAVPLPFAVDGGPNRRFERGWTRLVDRLADWSTAHHLSLLHLAWPGLVWSEMGVTQQMMDRAGLLVRAGARHAPPAAGPRLGREHVRAERGVPVRGIRAEPALRRSQAAPDGELRTRPMHPLGEQPDRSHESVAPRAAAAPARGPDAATGELVRLVGRLRRRAHDVRGVRRGLHAFVHGRDVRPAPHGDRGVRLGLPAIGPRPQLDSSSTRVSNARTGCVAGPRRTVPSTSENTLPCAGHVTVGPTPFAFTTPRSSGAP